MRTLATACRLVTLVGLFSIKDFATAKSVYPMNLFEEGKFFQRMNLLTGERYVKDLTKISPPDRVGRLRLLIGTARALSSSQYVDVFRLRLRWIDPEFWNDNWTNMTRRAFDINCEIEDKNTGVKYKFLDMRIASTLTGYDENFLIHDKLPVLLRCRIRSINGYNLASKWRESSTIKLYNLYSRFNLNDNSQPQEFQQQQQQQQKQQEEQQQIQLSSLLSQPTQRNTETHIEFA